MKNEHETLVELYNNYKKWESRGIEGATPKDKYGVSREMILASLYGCAYKAFGGQDEVKFNADTRYWHFRFARALNAMRDCTRVGHEAMDEYKKYCESPYRGTTRDDAFHAVPDDTLRNLEIVLLDKCKSDFKWTRTDEGYLKVSLWGPDACGWHEIYSAIPPEPLDLIRAIGAALFMDTMKPGIWYNLRIAGFLWEFASTWMMVVEMIMRNKFTMQDIIPAIKEQVFAPEVVKVTRAKENKRLKAEAEEARRNKGWALSANRWV